MGKLNFLIPFCVINSLLLFTSCIKPNYILVKNKGVFKENIYSNERYSVCYSSSLVKTLEIDSIRLDLSDIPVNFKKHLLYISKFGADVIIRATSNNFALENLFLVRYKVDDSLDKFTRNRVQELNKITIKKPEVEFSKNIIAISDEKMIQFTFEPSNFVKTSKINIIYYEIKEDEFNYEFIEYHFLSPDKKSIIRAINCINKNKLLKNFSSQEEFKHNFTALSFYWFNSLDSSVRKNKIDSKKITELFILGDSILKTNGIKAAYDTLKALKIFYTENNDFQSKSYYYQILGTFASFAGDNLLSLESESFAYPKSKTERICITNSTILNAKDYITSKFGNESVIMINEAHNRGQNRDFGRQLFLELYKQGFRYLCVEGLNIQNDSILNFRGFPIFSTGNYVKESAYGQLIRDALRLGVKLVAYEYIDTSAYNPNISWFEGLNIREEGQAKNILTILKEDPKAKLLIYAGYGHIEKKSNDGWIRMGQRLCKALNRNIPSIDCTLMKEDFDLSKENSYYSFAMDSFKSDKPFVLIQNDTPFVDSSMKGKVDFNVFMPRTNYDLGYPDWLKETDDTYYTLKIPKNCDDAYLQVYKINEWKEVKKEAIPVMQFTLQKDRPEYKLYLRKGEYKVFISKNNRNIVDDYFTVN